jgi:hypothetical protein
MRPHREIAQAQLADADSGADWQTAIRELRQAVIGIAGLLDDFEERVSSLERGKAAR